MQVVGEIDRSAHNNETSITRIMMLGIEYRPGAHGEPRPTQPILARPARAADSRAGCGWRSGRGRCQSSVPRLVRDEPEQPHARVLTLLTSLGDTMPAVILGRRGDVLAWNRAGHALVAEHLDFSAPEDPAHRPRNNFRP
ncbi:hypothetical protein [Nocardia sp. NPDC058666]|uniref:MmyB family transcriptional regulator n=1 Tax=Nocardia sp. NPDC058666 TaxID=3346587 RepID=UPI00365D321F